jgi:fatty acid desaturase
LERGGWSVDVALTFRSVWFFSLHEKNKLVDILFSGRISMDRNTAIILAVLALVLLFLFFGFALSPLLLVLLVVVLVVVLLF